MDSLIEDALAAQTESASIEFKSSFDVSSPQDWCEIIKDLIAIANTGGGVVLFGVDDNGVPIGGDVTSIQTLDPADVSNKILKYTSRHFMLFSIHACERAGHNLAAIAISGVSIPIVFEKPGTYDIGGGRQKTAFSAGSVYFRHGAKSEPGTTDDLRIAFERYLEIVRESWLKNIRQVTEAPLGSTFLTIAPGSDPAALPVRLTNDPEAQAIVSTNPDNTHPYRSKELIIAVNQRLPEGVRINSFDVQSIRQIYNIEANPAFQHKPRFGSAQYSPSFVAWIVEQYQANNNFFEEVRQEMSKRRKQS